MPIDESGGRLQLTDWISVVIAALALWVAYRANKKADEALRIESARRTDEIASAKKASLVAGVVGDPYHGYRLRVSNDGPSEARNIGVQVEGEDFTEWPPSKGASFPATQIAPGHTVFADLNMSVAPKGFPLKATVTWDDDYEEGRKIEVTLTVSS